MGGDGKESLMRKKEVTFKRRSSRVGARWACLSADNLSLPRRRNSEYRKEEKVRPCGW